MSTFSYKLKSGKSIKNSEIFNNNNNNNNDDDDDDGTFIPTCYDADMITGAFQNYLYYRTIHKQKN